MGLFGQGLRAQAALHSVTTAMTLQVGTKRGTNRSGLHSAVSFNVPRAVEGASHEALSNMASCDWP